MQDDILDQLVCTFHGKQFCKYCRDCGLLLCPECTGCESHKIIKYEEMKAEVDSGKVKFDVEDLKKKASDCIPSHKKRLSTFKGDVELDEVALKSIKERLEGFDEETKKDVELFDKLKKKIEEVKEKATTNVLKTNLGEALKNVFGPQQIEGEKKSMEDERARLETKLAKDNVEYNKSYQKVLIMEILMDM